MKHLVRGPVFILVADAVARSVCDYADALARNARTDRVDVPTFDRCGCGTTTSVHVASGRPLLVLDADDDELGDDLDGPFAADTRAFVADITARTAALAGGGTSSR
ncbi:hypothetical protein DEI92_07290 [Curtobacterium sp. MCBD17_034]|uniref:hypothetical protein n=1 Tax=unclassified Curtobacterium TaxID=257496 RepID=UPI000DA9A6A4|nr:MULTISPECIES: hypothetical protein [unclassified Curtobacterium]PZF60170.1 hypothetical protein DEI92_07290 [Curtobacterium sp. MCBD17_034]PZM34855.1 hypothetical protein DEI90_05275 [Curtobacterium sp. MCBD17_031]